MVRLLAMGLGLFALWLLLSGLFEPLLIGLGILSCIATMAIANRMGIFDRQNDSPRHSVIKFIAYWVWLAIEIAKSNWAVSKVILAKPLSLKQSLFDVPTSQKSDLGKVLYANSITLTPGTITVETEEGHFLIHALTEAAADLDALADMDSRVTEIEQKNGGA